MRKKLILIFLIIALMLTLCSCGGANFENDSNPIMHAKIIVDGVVYADGIETAVFRTSDGFIKTTIDGVKYYTHLSNYLRYCEVE